MFARPGGAGRRCACRRTKSTHGSTRSASSSTNCCGATPTCIPTWWPPVAPSNGSKSRRKQEVEKRRRAAEGAPAGRAPTNEALQRVRLALAQAEANVAATRVRLADTAGPPRALARHGHPRAAIRGGAGAAQPRLLDRAGQLRALVTRREKALMSEEVDSTRAAQFRVIDPPRASDQPVFPNRRAHWCRWPCCWRSLAGVAAPLSSCRSCSPTFDSTGSCVA